MNGVLSLPGMRANPDLICRIADYIGAIPTVSDQTQPQFVRWRKALDKYRSMWVQDVLWEAAVRKEPAPSGFENYESFKSNIIERARLSPEEASGLFTKEWKNEVPLRVRDLDWYYDVKVDVEGLE